MGVSIMGLEKRMHKAGYRMTSQTIKYYIDFGLLPKPVKVGGHGRGVRLVFQDEEATVSRLKKIAELKGRGFKLNEIPRELWRAGQEEMAREAREKLSKFVDLRGDFFEEIQWAPGSPNYESNGYKFAHYVFADSAADLLDETLWRAEDLHKYDTLARIREDFSRIEETGLWLTPYCYGERFVYEKQDLYLVARFVDLNRGYGLSWETIEALSARNRENGIKLEQWPEVDGVRFSEAWIGVQRKHRNNAFASEFVDRLTWIRDGSPIMPQDPRSYPYWHSRYGTVDELIGDFLAGRCAFVPSPVQEPHRFLKRFDDHIS